MHYLSISLGAMLLSGVTTSPDRPAEAVGEAVGPCRPADTVVVPERLAYLRDFISSTEAVYQAPRDSVGVAKQPASKVRLVSTASLCQAGVDALNRLYQTSGAVREIWLFALGSGYAIHDPDIPSSPGQPRRLFFFDIQFRYLGTLMVF